MILRTTLEDLPPLPTPIGLTIGTFDGVHLGHRHLLQKLKDQTTAVVVTFSDHPHATLTGRRIPQISTLEHKLLLLEKEGVFLTLLLTFSDFAHRSYDTFLREIKKALPFSLLVLGGGATFGKAREGTQEAIEALQLPLSFESLYLPPFLLEKTAPSSTLIRAAIERGDFEKASSLLGRPYSIYHPSPTATLILPPEGSYTVSILHEEKKTPGLAIIEKGSFRIEGASHFLGQPIEIVF